MKSTIVIYVRNGEIERKIIFPHQRLSLKAKSIFLVYHYFLQICCFRHVNKDYQMQHLLPPLFLNFSLSQIDLFPTRQAQTTPISMHHTFPLA